MPTWSVFANRWPVLAAVDSLLRGVGQIAFMNNPVTGLLILVALLATDTHVGVMTIAGLVVSTFTAWLLRLDRRQIRAGLFGYNGALAGAALAVFLLPRWGGEILLGAALCGAASTIVQVAVSAALGPLRLPPLTLSFNVVAIAFLSSTYAGGRIQRAPGLDEVPRVASVHPVTPPADSGSGLNNPTACFNAIFRGIAQLFLVHGVVAGVLIAIAILVCSPVAMAMAVVGSAAGALVGVALGANAVDVYHGLWGFNSFITAVAIGGVFIAPTPRSLCYALTAAAAAAIAYGALATVLGRFGAPPLTLPFCLTTLVFLLIKDATPLFSTVPLSDTTTADAHRRPR